ncbi:MAG: hypothetical protein IPI21_13430 [Propionivibrio sp.]|nr:hypothetical protein [Propionivibrio sp.]
MATRYRRSDTEQGYHLSPCPISRDRLSIPPEVKGIGDTTQAIKRWIEGNTSKSGRILFEITSGNKLDSAQIVGYLAASTGREFIRGPYPNWAYASFEDAKAFGLPIERMPHEKFFELLELYNVNWIAAWHTTSLQYLDGLAGLEKLEQVGPMHFFRVTREANYFLSGSGKILARSPNSLLLDELTGSEVVLKYHFVKGLVTEPPLQLEPKFMGSPAPFIKLINPPPKLRIFLDH